ncbi:hypothetical protein Y032_0066g3720 [Ancylostoma ceylanicum]|uniref:Zinc metalloproteinase n=2 Tax=Ancylostoma ceylanicum TaxID=53326 RepID=A0A016U159_9BILA|nr:hypothetical protein Y032_0066g3720 [Ancylostoma ceylanicum]
MRPLLLALLLIVCVNAGFSDFKDKVKDFFSGVKIGERAKKALEKLKKVFNVTKLLHVKEKLNKVKAKLLTKLVMPKEVQEALKEKLKSLIHRKKDKVSPNGDTIDEINQKHGLQDVMFQGDIILNDQQTQEVIEDVEEQVSGNRTKRQAFVDRYYPQTTWQQGVNYFFDSSVGYTLRRIFKKGAEEWSKNTCIDFRENSTAQDRIRIFVEDGCWSYVGRLGGQQDLSLGEGCDAVSIAAHELGHAIGLYHTQSRYDRDRYITLYAQNVKPDWLDQFAKQSMATNNNYGITYDFGGIMHYGATSATGNGEPTMVPSDTKYIETLGSPFVSFYELDMVNKHYKCHDKCHPSRSAKCKMDGFPHPRDCTRCICPSGYGGRLCDERPSGCGRVLMATGEYQTLTDVIGDRSAGTRAREDFKLCNYWIEAPQGSRIEVKVVSFTAGVANDGCPYAGVEIKTHRDHKLTGYRLCAPEDAGVTFISHSHIVPIITYNRMYETKTVLQYRIVGGGTRVTGIRPNPTTASPNCYDSYRCSALEKIGICTSPSFSESLKKTLCPKLCGYCR